MDVDFSSTVDELIPNCEALVKVRTGLMRGWSLGFVLYIFLNLARGPTRPHEAYEISKSHDF
jgi:hypothetical protein